MLPEAAVDISLLGSQLTLQGRWPIKGAPRSLRRALEADARFEVRSGYTTAHVSLRGVAGGSDSSRVSVDEDAAGQGETAGSSAAGRLTRQLQAACDAVVDMLLAGAQETRCVRARSRGVRPGPLGQAHWASVHSLMCADACLYARRHAAVHNV